MTYTERAVIIAQIIAELRIENEIEEARAQGALDQVASRSAALDALETSLAAITAE